MGENSPNLVTLTANVFFGSSVADSVTRFGEFSTFEQL
jgi:hypothetical protein